MSESYRGMYEVRSGLNLLYCTKAHSFMISGLHRDNSFISVCMTLCNNNPITLEESDVFTRDLCISFLSIWKVFISSKSHIVLTIDRMIMAMMNEVNCDRSLAVSRSAKFNVYRFLFTWFSVWTWLVCLKTKKIKLQARTLEDILQAVPLLAWTVSRNSIRSKGTSNRKVAFPRTPWL